MQQALCLPGVVEALVQPHWASQDAASFTERVARLRSTFAEMHSLSPKEGEVACRMQFYKGFLK